MLDFSQAPEVLLGRFHSASSSSDCLRAHGASLSAFFYHAKIENTWIPDFSENSPWRWEWWKVGLAPEDLFTTLEAKYNTVPYRIQGDEAFHHDVSDAAHEAKNLDDFHAKLALRRDRRLQELRKAWDSVAIKIICSPSKVFGGDLTHWAAFQQFTSNRSLDALVLFFHSLLPPPAPAAPQLRDPQLRDPQLPGSPPVETDHTEPSLPDTALASPCSPQAKPTH